MLDQFKTWVVILVSLNIVGCATVEGIKQDTASLVGKVTNGDSDKTSQTTDNRPCVANYKVDGNFFTGKTHKSFQEYNKVKKDTAITKISQHLAINGWKSVTTDKDNGIISATQQVIDGNGQEIPLNILVTNIKDGGIRVDTTVNVTGMLIAGGIEDDFCKILAAVTE
jgi:predicted small secreted protein